MPFGNSVSTSSHEFEMQGTLNRLRLQQPRPGFYGLSHAARTTARAAFVDQAVSHEGVSAAHDSVFQPIVHEVVERPEEQPHPSHHVQDVTKAHAQHGDGAMP